MDFLHEKSARKYEFCVYFCRDMDCEYIDLLELQSQLREEIESSFPERVWVRAEIASVQAKANGHCYLDLAQSEEGRIVAKAKAVIWRSRFAPLRAYFREATGGELAPGMEVLLRVQVSYSELYGMTLTVDEVEPRFTLGAAELQRRRTLEKLEADGLLDRQQELEPALLPYRLAVISARDAAGYGDFRRHLEENAYGFVFAPELCKEIASLPKGTFSRWIEIDGWSFLVRKDGESAGVAQTFEEAYDAIAESVKEEASKKAYHAWIERLRAETYIKVF